MFLLEDFVLMESLYFRDDPYYADPYRRPPPIDDPYRDPYREDPYRFVVLTERF